MCLWLLSPGIFHCDVRLFILQESMAFVRIFGVIVFIKCNLKCWPPSSTCSTYYLNINRFKINSCINWMVPKNPFKKCLTLFWMILAPFSSSNYTLWNKRENVWILRCIEKALPPVNSKRSLSKINIFAWKIYLQRALLEIKQSDNKWHFN